MDFLPSRAGAVGNPAPFKGNVQPQNFPTGRQWVVVLGLLVVCGLTLLWVSHLIGAVECAGQRSFDADVFTKPRLDFWNTDELSAAMALWRDAQTCAPSFDIEGLLAWHVRVDALVFVPTYCAFLYFVLRRVNSSKRVAVVSASATAVADWMETSATWFFLVWHQLKPSNAIWIIQSLTLLKWVAIAASVLTIVVLWIRQHYQRGSNE